MPLISSLTPPKIPLALNNFGVSSNEVAIENVSRTDVFGTGLKNDVGEYNCFLNVIIQVCAVQWLICYSVIQFVCAFHFYFFCLFCLP